MKQTNQPTPIPNTHNQPTTNPTQTRNTQSHKHTHTHGKNKQLGVELVVQERPARALEPGLSKSLHTRDWNGDVYLEDRNWLGLNQVNDK
jgi:hypothetical protein